MSRRFFAEQPIQGELTTLSGTEAHHLIHVLRARIADQVVVFDGQGGECLAAVESVGRREIQLRVLRRSAADREVSFPLVLAVALPRGDRQELLVQKAVEVGVTRLVPWQTERSVARPTEKTLERLRRTVIEASKQCGRNRLMQIEEPQEFVSDVARTGGALALLAHPDPVAPPVARVLLEHLPFGPQGVILGVGPEGGFTDDEVTQSRQAGWISVDLGERILRTETAATTLAALAMFLAATGRAAAGEHSV